MASRTIAEIVESMEAGREIHFGDLAKVCDHYFGEPRQKGTSHRVYKMPWPGDPRVNIQNDKGKAKPEATDKPAGEGEQAAAKE